MPVTHLPTDEPTCSCGARIDDDNAVQCRKCAARARWQRRQANGRRHSRRGRPVPPDQYR